MCLPPKPVEKIEKKFRLADFFDMWWDDYCLHPERPLFPEQYKAVNAIRVCRTEVLGVDYYACPDCGELSEVRLSCKNRFCPTCSWKDTIVCAEDIKSEMLDIPHRHVVFTLPHKLNPLLKANKVDMLNILASTAADTFKDWMKSKFGIKTGIIGVIHTYGEKKNLHPHIHMIVAWGGIEFKTGSLAVISGKFVKYAFLQNKFRCKFEDKLIALFDSGELKHSFPNRRAFMQFIKNINRDSWKINIEDPMECPAEVIRYIGRYSKRACLSEYKITNIEGEFITFNYKDYKDRQDPDDRKSPAKVKPLRLHYKDFFPRLLQHVPPPRFRMVRYYGCYGRFKNIPENFKANQKEEKLSEAIEIEYQVSENNPKFCSACTVAKVYVNTLMDRRKKQERNAPFDIKIHKHVIYRKQEFTFNENNSKKAA